MRARKINNIIRLIQRSWRPLMAITMVFVLFLYLIVGFFINIYGIQSPPLPDGAWALLSVFAGSYTISRGAEKFSRNWNNPQNKNINKPPQSLDNQEES